MKIERFDFGFFYGALTAMAATHIMDKPWWVFLIGLAMLVILGLMLRFAADKFAPRGEQ